MGFSVCERLGRVERCWGLYILHFAFCICVPFLFTVLSCIVLIGSGFDLVLELAVLASMLFWEGGSYAMPCLRRTNDILAFPTIVL